MLRPATLAIAALSSIVLSCRDAGVSALSEAPPSARPPQGEPLAKNVVLISIDTLRADHLGCYGYPRQTSPWIDDFAARSVRFHSAMSQFTTTAPSMFSTFSSTYVRAHGMRNSAIAPAAPPLLQSSLSEAGYTTVAVASNPNLQARLGFARGFDQFVRATAASVNKSALDLLPLLGQEEKFFLWVHYMEPHAPYQPKTTELAERFTNDAHDIEQELIPFNEGHHAGHGGIPTAARIGDNQRLGFYISQYDAEIYAVDRRVGELMDALEEQGLLEDTLVVLIADHGEGMGEHNLYFCHGPSPYGHLSWVPLIVSLPGDHPPRVESLPVGLIDVTPTILDLVGVDTPSEMRGDSLRRLLTDTPTPADTRPVFSETTGAVSHASVRYGDWKLIRTLTRKQQKKKQKTEPKWELYDLATDPDELDDLTEEKPEVAAEMKGLLKVWEEENVEAPPIQKSFAVLDSDSLDRLEQLGYVVERAGKKPRKRAK